MIKKIYRLKEKEVKKVLAYWKPFFSYWIVLNYKENKLNNNRFAIVIWKKSVKNNVERNFFRRRFYDLISEEKSIHLDGLENTKWKDFVFVVKKQTKLSKKEEESYQNFKKDIFFLLNKFAKIWKD